MSKRILGRRGVAAAAALIVLGAIGAIASQQVGSGAGRALRATLPDLVRFAGGEPERCVFGGPDRRICRWLLAGRLLTADPKTESAGSDGVHLICAVPIHGTLAEDGECTVRALGADSAQVHASLEDAEREAGRALARARDVAALSSLVGDVPDVCLTLDEAQRCRWKLDAAKPGSQQLRVLAETSTTPHLQCEIPLSGSAREARSCRMLAGEDGALVGVNAPAIDAYEQVVLLSASAD